MTRKISDRITDEAHKTDRVKARWAILRRALLDSSSTDKAAPSNDSNKTDNLYSMNSFPGFGVLNRTVVNDESHKYQSFATTDEDGEWNIVKNSYTSNNIIVQFHTREAKTLSQKMKREALFSHRKYGVDNTGNVRVWDAESTLAGFLVDALFGVGEDIAFVQGADVYNNDNFSSLKKHLRMILLRNDDSDSQNCSILELGAGQAGLSGLALVAASCSSGVGMMKKLQLTLTDGHPKCVQSNSVCAQMMLVEDTVGNFSIDTTLLLWDSSQDGFETCKYMQESVDLCLASDCVHFQEYHDGLLLTIARTLAVNGIALLCQPRRGSSLDNFVALVNLLNGDNPLFEMCLFEDFHPKVSHMHSNLSKHTGANTSYNPNWHQPLLLCLKKIRRHDEDVDGNLVRQHVKRYNNATKKEEPKQETNRLAPYNPTHSTAQSKALELLDLQSNDVLFDLGCGDGRLLMMALEAAFEKNSELRCVGIEYDQDLSNTARENIKNVLTSFNKDTSSPSARAFIRWDDVLNEKNDRNKIEQLTLLNDATAVFVYLLPGGLKKVKPLLMEAAMRSREKRKLDQSSPPFRVVSYMFSIPGCKPVSVDTSSKGGCALHLYRDDDLLESVA